MTPVLCLVFLLSGASALVFENLWFRQAGFLFGTSVWASSVVLSGFMGGLALGNAWAARRGARIARPIRAYAALEALVGISGAALVLALPELPGALAPLFRPLLDSPLALNLLRFGLALGLLLVPSAAMGATLPLLVKSLHRERPGFGSALGWLYGWNTLGAMAGAVAAEEWLVPWLGIRASAGAALGMNALAVLACLTLLRRYDRPLAEAPGPAPLPASRLDAARLRLLAATFLAGAALLALEVVWFRFLLLRVHSSTRSFAVMLMAVLLGIGCGGLAAGAWLRRSPQAYRLFGPLALAAGAIAVGSYAGADRLVGGFDGPALSGFGEVARAALAMMLPVSLISGLLFTFAGRGAFDRWGEETRSTGWITTANTLGSALGALLAAWWLLPFAGIERAFLGLALAYGGVALVAPPGLWPRLERGGAALVGALALAYALALLAFPFGQMRDEIVPRVASRWMGPESRIAEAREGLTETLVYVENRRYGEILDLRLVTNSFSMAGTTLPDKRYMGHFAYWPLAFHPRVRKALLISYGVGVTASALLGAPEIERLDVVDISPGILEASRVVYPDPAEHPLDDPRTRVFLEDGRFFLLVTDERYDLVTGEPPPPTMAGVVNLYSQEYFELVRARLAEGGFVTYWLPVAVLDEAEARHVIKGFCNAFPDCSLWRGVRWDWMLVGSNGARGPVSRERFERQWRDPSRARELRVLGFERPELLVTTFLADADTLRALTRSDEPLVDAFPARLGSDWNRSLAFFAGLSAPDRVRRRLEASAWLRRLAPPELVDSAAAYFPDYAEMEALWVEGGRGERTPPWRRVDRLLGGHRLATFAQWHLGDGLEHAGIIERLAERGAERPAVLFFRGLRALARGEFAEAAAELEALRREGIASPEALRLEILAEAYQGRIDRAQSLAERLAALSDGGGDPAFWDFAAERFGLRRPQEPGAGARRSPARRPPPGPRRAPPSGSRPRLAPQVGLEGLAQALVDVVALQQQVRRSDPAAPVLGDLEGLEAPVGVREPHPVGGEDQRAHRDACRLGALRVLQQALDPVPVDRLAHQLGRSDGEIRDHEGVEVAVVAEQGRHQQAHGAVVALRVLVALLVVEARDRRGVLDPQLLELLPRHHLEPAAPPLQVALELPLHARHARLDLVRHALVEVHRRHQQAAARLHPGLRAAQGGAARRQEQREPAQESYAAQSPS